MPSIISLNLPSFSSLWDKLNDIIYIDDLENICSDFDSIFSESSEGAQISPTVTTSNPKPPSDVNPSPTPPVAAPPADPIQTPNAPTVSTPESSPPIPPAGAAANNPTQPVNEPNVTTSDLNQ